MKNLIACSPKQKGTSEGKIIVDATSYQLVHAWGLLLE